METYQNLTYIAFTETEVRSAVVMALVHNNGEVDNRSIADTLGVGMRTIQRIRKKLEESRDPRGVITRAPKSFESRRKSRNLEFIKKVEEMIKDDPSRSLKSMADELGVDKKTVKRCIDEDLH